MSTHSICGSGVPAVFVFIKHESQTLSVDRHMPKSLPSQIQSTSLSSSFPFVRGEVLPATFHRLI